MKRARFSEEQAPTRDSLRLSAGNDRLPELAGAQSRGHLTDRGWLYPELSRRRQPTHLQTNLQRNEHDRSSLEPCSGSARDRPRRTRLLSVWLRRAAIQLARIPHADRFAHARSSRTLSGIPHLCRQSLLHTRRSPCRSGECGPRDPAHHGPQPTIQEPSIGR
jgi:hypothetical protein